MPPSAEARVAVVHLLDALENSCADAERCMIPDEWERLEAALSEQRRLTHELQNQWESGTQPAAFQADVARRLESVLATRENQLRRLTAFHDEIGSRLTLTSRWRNLQRTVGRERVTSSLASLDRSQ